MQQTDKKRKEILNANGFVSSHSSGKPAFDSDVWHIAVRAPFDLEKLIRWSQAQMDGKCSFSSSSFQTLTNNFSGHRPSE